jgi:hypothetical protein
MWVHTTTFPSLIFVFWSAKNQSFIDFRLAFNCEQKFYKFLISTRIKYILLLLDCIYLSYYIFHCITSQLSIIRNLYHHFLLKVGMSCICKHVYDPYHVKGNSLQLQEGDMEDLCNILAKMSNLRSLDIVITQSPMRVSCSCDLSKLHAIKCMLRIVNIRIIRPICLWFFCRFVSIMRA